MGAMDKDQYYAEMLNMMREQGSKDNPSTIQLGVMQSPTSVKIDDLVLNAEDLYIADYLVKGYMRELETPYIPANSADTEQTQLIYKDELKKGDLVAVQKLNDGKYVILVRVVQV